MTKRQQDAAHISQIIKAFLDGSGGDWDWDDFTSCPISDPHLDSIRGRAAPVERPGGDQERAILEDLAKEADHLAEG